MRYRVHGVDVESAMPLPELRRSTTRGTALSIELSATPVPEPPSWFHAWRTKDDAGRLRRRPWLAFARTPDGYLLRFPDLADVEVSADGGRICCTAAPRVAAATLRHLLIDQVLPLAISRRGPLVLHASAVHVPGYGAVAFAGRAGCGKSTLAAAVSAQGGGILTDDCLVVVRDARGWSVLPGYPGLRVWSDSARALGIARDATVAVAHYTAKRRVGPGPVSFHPRPSRLRAVCVLGRFQPPGRPSQVRPLGAREALLALTPFVTMLDIADPRQLTRMFGDLTRLAAGTPIVGLRLRDDRRQLPAVAAEVLAGLAVAGRDSC